MEDVEFTGEEERPIDFTGSAKSPVHATGLDHFVVSFRASSPGEVSKTGRTQVWAISETAALTKVENRLAREGWASIDTSSDPREFD